VSPDEVSLHRLFFSWHRDQVIRNQDKTQALNSQHRGIKHPRLTGWQQQFPLLYVSLSSVVIDETEIEAFNSYCCRNDCIMCLLHSTSTTNSIAS